MGFRSKFVHLFVFSPRRRPSAVNHPRMNWRLLSLRCPSLRLYHFYLSTCVYRQPDTHRRARAYRVHVYDDVCIHDPVRPDRRAHAPAHAQNEYEFLASWKTVKRVFDSVPVCFIAVQPMREKCLLLFTCYYITLFKRSLPLSLSLPSSQQENKPSYC